MNPLHLDINSTIGWDAMYKGNRIMLRAVEKSDIPEILTHFNDLEVRRFLYAVTPVSAEQ